MYPGYQNVTQGGICKGPTDSDENTAIWSAHSGAKGGARVCQVVKSTHSKVQTEGLLDVVSLIVQKLLKTPVVGGWRNRRPE